MSYNDDEIFTKAERAQSALVITCLGLGVWKLGELVFAGATIIWDAL